MPAMLEVIFHPWFPLKPFKHPSFLPFHHNHNNIVPWKHPSFVWYDQTTVYFESPGCLLLTTPATSFQTILSYPDKFSWNLSIWPLFFPFFYLEEAIFQCHKLQYSQLYYGRFFISLFSIGTLFEIKLCNGLVASLLFHLCCDLDIVITCAFFVNNRF